MANRSHAPNSSHCKENPIYVLPEKKLLGLIPSLHIYVSVSELDIPILPIFLEQNRQTDRENILYKSLTET
jgi:hypothetical protein